MNKEFNLATGKQCRLLRRSALQIIRAVRQALNRFPWSPMDQPKPAFGFSARGNSGSIHCRIMNPVLFKRGQRKISP